MEAKKTVHTATPWKVLYLVYEDATTLKVVPCDRREPAYFMVGGDNRKANAEFMVRAVNAHDELVTACKAMAELPEENFHGCAVGAAIRAACQAIASIGRKEGS